MFSPEGKGFKGHWGKGKGDPSMPQVRGGWKEKAKRLCRMLKNGQVEEATQLAAEYSESGGFYM